MQKFTLAGCRIGLAEMISLKATGRQFDYVETAEIKTSIAVFPPVVDMSLPRELWDRIRKIIAGGEDLNEANTKGKLIEPVLSALGWDLIGEDVEREWEVDIGSGKAHADYALNVERQPLVLIEAKSLLTELDEKQARQVLSYAAVEKVRWCALTNGRQYQIFNSEWSSKPHDALFCQFNLSPEGPVPKELEYLSREFISSGRLDELSGQSKFALRLKAHLSQSIDDLSEELWLAARNKLYREMKSEVPGVTRGQVFAAVKSLLRIQIAGNEALEAAEVPVLEPPSGSAVAAHFTGKKANMKPVFDALVSAVQDRLGQFTIYGMKYYIALKDQRLFATVEVRNKWLLVGVALRNPQPSPRLCPAPKGGWTWITHYFDLDNPSDVNRQAVDWVLESKSITHGSN